MKTDTTGPEGINMVRVVGRIETKPQMRSGADKEGRPWRMVQFKLRLPRKDGVIGCVLWWRDTGGPAADLMAMGDRAKGTVIEVDGSLQSRPVRKGKAVFTFQAITVARFKVLEEFRGPVDDESHGEQEKYSEA